MGNACISLRNSATIATHQSPLVINNNESNAKSAHVPQKYTTTVANNSNAITGAASLKSLSATNQTANLLTVANSSIVLLVDSFKSRQNDLRVGGETDEDSDIFSTNVNIQKSILQRTRSEMPISKQDNTRIGTLLKNVPLFNKLTEADRARLGGALVERVFIAERPIFQQGDVGDGFYILVQGEVLVLQNGKELARLKPGDFFGETALLSTGARSATCLAITDVRTWFLNKTEFFQMFGNDKLNVQFAKRNAITSERKTIFFSNHHGQFMPPGSSKKKSSESVQLIFEAMKNNVMFMGLDTEHKALIIEQMWRMEFACGTDAIRQGDPGDNLYIVEEGEFSIIVNGKQVAIRSRGSCFGELALMYNTPRAATVTAVVDCTVWTIDRFTYRRIVTDLSERKFALYLQFLKSVDLLAPLADYERRKVAEAVEEVKVQAGYEIFKEGAAGDAMYFVQSGDVLITKENEAVEVTRCKTGSYFGERALITNEPRAATAVAVNAVHLLKLDRSAFTLLLGPLEDILKQRVVDYTNQDKRRRTINLQREAASAVSLANQRPIRNALATVRPLPPPFSALKIIGTLGKGSFGFVQLVQDPVTKTTYALKAVNKFQIVQTGQQAHILSEKRAMTLFDHPFLIKLYGTYKDEDRVYFLLEPSLGGELFNVLRQRTLFDEDIARFYAAQVVLAFEYIHNHGYVYRDLKPENLLLAPDGYLKITDFGFAKEVGNGRTWTLCGTPDYLAPEIVSGRGHGKAVDWWTLGIFLYEMLASYPPFYDEDPLKTYAKILAGNVSYPSHFSRSAIDLISHLLTLSPSTRLGMLQGGSLDIKKHSFFRSIDWDRLYYRKIKAPIVPKIRSELDMSNYEAYADTKPHPVLPYSCEDLHWDDEF